MKNKAVWALVAVFVSAMLLGEALIYVVDPYDYDIEISEDDGILSYSAESSTATDYHVEILSGTVAAGGAYCYYDRAYGVSTVTYDDLDLLMDEFESELVLRGADYEGRLNAQESAALMAADLAQGTAGEHAYICCSGAFPDTIYTGAADDLLVRWLQAGGTVYWINDVIGLYSADGQGGLRTVDNYSELLFGTAGAVSTGTEMVLAEDPGSERTLGAALSVYYTLTNNGLRSDLPDSISIGFEKDGFGSVVLAKCSDGDGTVCVFGGTSLRGYFNKEAPRFLAQVISAHLGYATELLAETTGTVDGTADGTVDLTGLDGSEAAFVYLGNTFALCGKYYKWP